MTNASETAAPERRNLVVVRAGANSLHRGWLGEGRSWDLGISSFHSDRAEDFPEARYFSFYKGGKWDGLYQFFRENAELLDRYDYIWLPDDDISTSVDDLNRVFALTRSYGLELAQPALTPDSYFWHPITLRCALTRVRYTTFVEVMVPVLRTDLLRKALPFFEHTKSGWGIDQMWARLTTDPRNKCAILDEIAVHHTRPVGSVLAQVMKSEGQSGENEMDRLSGLFDVHAARPLCFRAITRGGLTVRGVVPCGMLQFVSQAPWRSAGRHWWPGPRVFLGSLFSHFRNRPNLTVIADPAPAVQGL